MRRIVKSFLVIALLLSAGCSSLGGSGVAQSERTQVFEHDGFYGLTVPVSRLLVIMPKGGWSLKNKNIGGGTSNPRYFYFENEKDNSILSGWFEPSRLFTNTRKLWEEESERQQKGGMPPAANVTYEKLGGWDVVMYDYVLGKATSSHIRGHWVQSGTWLDIHISITTDKLAAENRKKLKSLLKTVAVRERESS